MLSIAAQTQMTYNTVSVSISAQQVDTVNAVVMLRAFPIVIEALLKLYWVSSPPLPY